MKKEKMKILVISAMVEEIDAIKSKFELEKIDEINMQDLYKISESQIYITNCGIGKSNAAITVTQLLNKYNFDQVINIGTCGSLSSDLNIGDFILADRLAYHDFNLSAFGREIGYIPGQEKYETTKGKYFHINNDVDFIKEIINKFYLNVHVGTIVTGDVFVDDYEVKTKIIQNFENVLGVDMESASIIQSIKAYNLCATQRAGYMVLRSVSDDASGKANISFNDYLLDVTQKYIRLIDILIENNEKRT